MFALLVAKGNRVVSCRRDDGLIIIVFTKRRYQFVGYLAIFGGTLAAQIERYAQPWMILQFVNGRIFAAWVRVPIQPARIVYQIFVAEGKFGLIEKLGASPYVSAYDVGVGVACQPRAGRINPIKGIFALFQSVGIKTGNLAVGRQVGGCAKNGSTALLRNKLIAIVE
ncbi:Uncharacterised protein [Neisseria meningitidis]|uniref:Uncharacterized protein n=1 Tax=Neisseria meningitidis TaxID=487 RepID=A0AAD2J7G3_NEIME|nr:Uncharacterised protein [Neisseria meningitidis]CWT84374.1 Uncharacterised protein [Neisseria meningitidis]